jgi:nicotinamide mononucleotide (NMN) deamidase PncC
VCLGWCVDGRTDAITVRLPGDRERVRQFATISVLNLLRQAVLDRPD